jgi:hypothetical protein
VKKYGHAIQYIKKPSLEVQYHSIIEDGSNITHIKNPTPIMMELSKLTRDIHDIPTPYHELSQELIQYIEKNIPYLLQFIPQIYFWTQKDRSALLGH